MRRREFLGALGGVAAAGWPLTATPRTLSIRPAQTLFPEFDYSRRKFTPSDSGASAGFRPHLKQGVIFAESFALGNLASFKTRPSLGCHFQELNERSDIFVGVHDNSPCRVQNQFFTPRLNT